MTRSRMRGKARRVQDAVRRQHAMMVSWHTRQDIRNRATKQADEAQQPRPHMHIGPRPAPVVHFIKMTQRSTTHYCKGHHVIGVECEFV